MFIVSKVQRFNSPVAISSVNILGLGGGAFVLNSSSCESALQKLGVGPEYHHLSLLSSYFASSKEKHMLSCIRYIGVTL